MVQIISQENHLKVENATKTISEIAVFAFIVLK